MWGYQNINEVEGRTFRVLSIDDFLKLLGINSRII